MAYDSGVCYTAGELRDMGAALSEEVPCCAWVPKQSIRVDGVTEGDTSPRPMLRFLEPFQWMGVTFLVGDHAE
jgi:hypothetical protein